FPGWASRPALCLSHRSIIPPDRPFENLWTTPDGRSGMDASLSPLQSLDLLSGGCGGGDEKGDVAADGGDLAALAQPRAGAIERAGEHAEWYRVLAALPEDAGDHRVHGRVQQVLDVAHGSGQVCRSDHDGVEPGSGEDAVQVLDRRQR